MTQQTAGSRSGSRLPSLTGARFIAAVLVFLFHSTITYPLASPDAQTTTGTLFGGAGFTGVTFFFVLSGFVLTWATRPSDTTPKFWRRRFFKIYPTHLLTFVVAAVLLLAVGPAAEAGFSPAALGDAVLNLVLQQSWHPDLAVRTSFNVVAWSLSCEVVFYLAFPLIIKLVDKVRPERLWAWTIGVAAAVIAVPALTGLVGGGTNFPGTTYTDRQFWIAFQSPPAALLLFVLGIFTAKIVLTGQRLPVRLGGAIALTIGAYFVLPLFGPLYQFSAVMAVPLSLLVAAAAVADAQGQRTFLGSRVMVWLGEISFAFYMWHYIVIAYGHKLLGPSDSWSTPTAIGVMVLLLAVVLALSWASFTFVERPIMRRFANPRRKRDLAEVPNGSVDSTSVTAGRAA